MGERGALEMSGKERETMVVMERVRRKEAKLAEAARMLGISYRQCGRRYKRYEAEGAAGLGSGTAADWHRRGACWPNQK